MVWSRVSLAGLLVLTMMAACSKSGSARRLTITSLTPTEGPVTGGTAVQVDTSGFQDDFLTAPPFVTFDGMAAVVVTPISPSQVMAITPPGTTPGLVDVQLSSTDLVQTAIRRGSFLYLPSPPMVIRTDPAPASSDVPVTVIPSATFDRDMDPLSFVAGSLTLDGSISGPLPIFVEYRATTRSARAVPIDPLPLGEQITATVSDTVTALQGMALSAPVTWSFETTVDPAHILITEVAVTDSAQEFIEIHNPTSSEIPLDGYGLADSTWIGPPRITQYYLIPELVKTGLPLIGTADDFAMGFPSGASIAPGEYQTVALAGSANFDSAWGVPPTYEISDDGAIPDVVLDMVEIFPGSIGTTRRLTNSGELVVLFFWNGFSDLVFDVDYVIWGDAITDPGTPEAVDKTGISLDGPDSDSLTTYYLPDTPLGNQEVVTSSAHSPGMSYQRLAPLGELAETAIGGNGITGHDETSEGLAVSNGGWTWTQPATPNLPGP